MFNIILDPSNMIMKRSEKESEVVNSPSFEVCYGGALRFTSSTHVMLAVSAARDWTRTW